MPAQRDRLGASDIALMLAQRLDSLVRDLFPAGHREGAEWRCGSVTGEVGGSLAIALAGERRGLWLDRATDQSGDALDLVAAVLNTDLSGALRWSRRWLGIDSSEAAISSRPASVAPEYPQENPNRWRRPWAAAVPIAGTLAETYLSRRGLQFQDPEGRVLRFRERHARKNPTGELEYPPAMLSALCDARTGEQVGTINCYLRRDGADRLRDKKGKTSWGRVRGAVVMLSPFEEPTLGLTVCEGTETGIALVMAVLPRCGAAAGAITWQRSHCWAVLKR